MHSNFCIAKIMQDNLEIARWKVLLKSCVFLLSGVGLVTIFSDPMVDSLTSLTDSTNNDFLSSNGRHGQHIPIPGL